MPRPPLGLLVTAVALTLLGYFAWHGTKGARSLANVERLVSEVQALEQKLGAARAERLAFERRVSLLRPESVDPDFADEMARRVLGFAAPRELVVREAPRNTASTRP
jgi:cell division protein FtsB